MTPLARHCALVAAGPRVWWQDKPLGKHYPRKPVSVRQMVEEWIAGRDADEVFGAVEILAANPGLTQKRVSTLLGEMLLARSVRRISVGRYVRNT